MAESSRFSREIPSFVIVGAISTALYAAVVLGITEFKLGGPIVANHVALAISSVWSYLAQRRLTFRYVGGHKTPMRRFAVQIAAIYLASNAIYLLVAHLGIAAIYGVVAVVLIVPVCNYLVMKFWVFRDA